MTAMLSEPQASRPRIPGYNLSTAEGGEGLLPWSWAVERLKVSRNYWLSTVNADGAPHAMPVWGVWLDDRFYFSTGEKTRKVRNLAGNPRCVVATERADEAVIVEGGATLESDAEVLAAFKAAYDPKYSFDIWTNGIFVVRPRTVFGFIEAAEHFGASATRWRFAES